jgi:hypothetical protein
MQSDPIHAPTPAQRLALMLAIATITDFYAVSGTRGEMIYYERCNFPNNDVLTCLYVSYPAAEKAKWDRSWHASGDRCV